MKIKDLILELEKFDREYEVVLQDTLEGFGIHTPVEDVKECRTLENVSNGSVIILKYKMEEL
jgi:hypothetical protein